MSEPQRSYFIRIELPPDATPDEISGLEKGVIELVDTFVETYDYDIHVDGGGWYPPAESEPITPIAVARGTLYALLYTRSADNSPTDTVILRAALQDLADLGMSQTDLQIYLECQRAVNSVALRNMRMEDNAITALDMVCGNVGNPDYRIRFP